MTGELPRADSSEALSNQITMAGSEVDGVELELISPAWLWAKWLNVVNQSRHRCHQHVGGDSLLDIAFAARQPPSGSAAAVATVEPCRWRFQN